MAYSSKTGLTSVPGTMLFADALTLTRGPNFVHDTGGANALAATLTSIVAGVNVTFEAGTSVYVYTGNALQKGANTFTLNGTSKNIKSGHNPSSDISTSTVAGAIIHLIYDGTQWQAVGY